MKTECTTLKARIHLLAADWDGFAIHLTYVYRPVLKLTKDEKNGFGHGVALLGALYGRTGGAALEQENFFLWKLHRYWAM